MEKPYLIHCKRKKSWVFFLFCSLRIKSTFTFISSFLLHLSLYLKPLEKIIILFTSKKDSSSEKEVPNIYLSQYAIHEFIIAKACLITKTKCYFFNHVK